MEKSNNVPMEQIVPNISEGVRNIRNLLLMYPLIQIFHSALKYHGGNIHIFRQHDTLTVTEMGYHTDASPGSFGKKGLRPFSLFE